MCRARLEGPPMFLVFSTITQACWAMGPRA